MRTRTLMLTASVCLAACAFCYASDAYMANWKLNEAKPNFSEDATKNHTSKYEASGYYVKVTVDGNDANGNSIHDEWTGKFDGKDYAVTGDPVSDMRSYKRVNEHTIAITVKKGGKVVASGEIVVSAD